MNKTKILLTTILIFLLIPLTQATEYDKLTGDSVFVVGVNYEQIDDESYHAFITVDLNYKDYLNPNNFQIAEQYNWNNYWKSNLLDYNDNYEIKSYNDNGIFTEYLAPFYFLEIYDEDSTPNPYEVSNIGYYGLPFYIHSVYFECDVNSESKGSLFLDSKETTSNLQTGETLYYTDVVSLIRPEYDGFSTPDYELLNGYPVGFGTYPGEVVRYNNIPVKCTGINTGSANLQVVLRPNLMYRFTHPDTENSEIWNYDDIISILPSISNNNYLDFNLNIDYNLSLDNSWTYNLSNEEFDDFTSSSFNPDKIRNLECVVQNKYGQSKEVLSEDLTNTQATNINSGWVDGELITCSYPETPIVSNINGKTGNDVIQALSLQQQQENLLKLDQLEKKFELKRFIVNSVLPILFYFVVIIFYILELIALGVAFIGFLPTMFKWFIEGIKDAFNVDELIDYKRGHFK